MTTTQQARTILLALTATCMRAAEPVAAGLYVPNALTDTTDGARKKVQ